MKSIALSVIAATVLTTTLADSAWSARRQRHHAGEGTVTACSRYGHGCMTVPIRRGQVETELRLPGGTWIGCRRDCRETLREEKLDFWETLRERQPSGTFGR